MIFICYSCGDKSINKEKERPFPIINDSTLFLDSNKHINWHFDGNDHEPVYIGKYKPIINLSPVENWGNFVQITIAGFENKSRYTPLRSYKRKLVPKKYTLEHRWEEKPFRYDSAYFHVRIDTSQLITNKGRNAYPVCIENITTDTVIVGYGTHIPITTKVKDRSGKWVIVPDYFSYDCGEGLQHIILPPREIIITTLLKKDTGTKTEFMIKFGKSYSKRFFANY